MLGKSFAFRTPNTQRQPIRKTLRQRATPFALSGTEFVCSGGGRKSARHSRKGVSGTGTVRRGRRRGQKLQVIDMKQCDDGIVVVDRVGHVRYGNADDHRRLPDKDEVRVPNVVRSAIREVQAERPKRLLSQDAIDILRSHGADLRNGQVVTVLGLYLLLSPGAIPPGNSLLDTIVAGSGRTKALRETLRRLVTLRWLGSIEHYWRGRKSDGYRNTDCYARAVV
jgi:hypothetical protein